MPLDPLIGGALISAGTNIASSVISNIGNRKAQKRAQRYNVENWNRQNLYNHPQQQMDRLRQAGLNPNLVYGQGGGSQQTGDIAPSKAAEYKMDLGDPIGKYYQGKSTEAVTDRTAVLIEQMETMMELSRAQRLETEARALGYTIDNRTKLLQETEAEKKAIYQTPLAEHSVDFNAKNLQIAEEIRIGTIQSTKTSKQLEATSRLQYQTLTQTQKSSIKIADSQYRQALETEKGLRLKNTYDSIRNNLAKDGIFENTHWIAKYIMDRGKKLPAGFKPLTPDNKIKYKNFKVDKPPKLIKPYRY